MATQSLQFDPKGFDLFSSNQPTVENVNGTTIPVAGYLFSTNGDVFFRRFCARAYLSGNLTCRVRWYSKTGQTTGDIQWSAAIAAVTPGDAQSVLTKALATATNTTTTVNSTARGDTTTDVTISNLDSLAEGDDVWLAVSKIGGTMTGGAVVVGVEILYAATGGVGAGNVSNAGASTDNAIARFDLATGQVIQNSAVTIADTTGHITQPAGGQLNGVDITNLDARLNPAGADTMFPGTWANGDAPIWNGSIWVPKVRACVTSSATQNVTTTVTDVTGVSFVIPRTGRYLLTVHLSYLTGGTTSGLVQYAIGFSGTAAMATEAVSYQTVAAGGFGSTGVLSTGLVPNSPNAAFTNAINLAGFGGAVLNVTAVGTVTLRIAKNAGPTITLNVGSGFTIYET